MLSGIIAAVSQRKFWDEDRIKRQVEQWVEDANKRLHARQPQLAHETNADNFRTMVLFSTPKQRTWLVADRWSVYCVLDDIRWEEPRVQWVAKPTEVQPRRAESDISPESGAVYFGEHGKDWLFSKDLFRGRDVVAAIQQFLTGAV